MILYPLQMLGGDRVSVVIEQGKDGLYYIGITDGNMNTFFYYTETFREAKRCAEHLKILVEDQLRVNSSEVKGGATLWH